MTTTPRTGNEEWVSPPTKTTDMTHIDGWITAELEQVLQRAVDLANASGHRQMHVEHVALAMLEDPQSRARTGWRGALTATQWQKVLSNALPARHVERDQPRQVTDIFCWRSSR
ncbi:Clp protease N-terminal domain-containing protein [Nocardia sp. NPDC051030]|uniref:Clp protease N-terminal domain-containing protein n=1 Tax=Nocardia sp. NPDC051030 TaxID=3155162 RepID=UPI00344514E2